MLLDKESAFTARIGDVLSLRYVVDTRTKEVQEELQPPSSVVVTDDADAVLADGDVGIVIELFGGIDAARSVVEGALKAGKDVVTANKALIATHGNELFELARKCGRSIAFEASVSGGIPIIAALRDGLIAEHIHSIYGIINGTCNYVLTQMAQGELSYADALAQAQQKGYAEADPRLDVEGHDSAHKLAVLARLAFGVNVDVKAIPCEGISTVTLEDIRYARSLGYILKLLAIGIRREQRVELRVNPVLLRDTHPLAAIGGAFNAVCVHGDTVGEVMFTGLGAGRWPTASAVMADVCQLALGTYSIDFAALSQLGHVPPAELVPLDDIRTRYYFRLSCLDQVGVLAQVAGLLAREGISIASCIQQQTAREDDQHVPVVFMTHEASEGAMRKALEHINGLDCVDGSRSQMLRVQDI